MNGQAKRCVSCPITELREDDRPECKEYSFMDLIMVPSWVLEYLRYNGLRYGSPVTVTKVGLDYWFEQGA